MPYKEREIKKMYYSMGEVTQMLKVNASLVRFWDKEFEIIKPKKNKKGNRLFTPEDVEHLKLIYRLVKEDGYTLKGAKELLKNNQDDAVKKQQVIDSLSELKGFLSDIRDNL